MSGVAQEAEQLPLIPWEPPACETCGDPMSLLCRQEETTVATFTFADGAIDITAHELVDMDTPEYWFACRSWACHVKRARQGLDFPFEREVPDEVQVT